MSPVTKISHAIDAIFRSASGNPESESQQLEDEILSAVEEGEKEGIVDEQERQMIESVIQFRDTTAGQIMTPRPEMVAIELPANLEMIKNTVEATGHSRIPVFERTLDHIVGILYARDLLRYIGQTPRKIRPANRRPPCVVCSRNQTVARSSAGFPPAESSYRHRPG